MIRDDKLESILLYIFSDLLLVVDDNTRKILKRINVNDKYYARREEDSKVYRNVIKVHSDGFTNFSAGP